MIHFSDSWNAWQKALYYDRQGDWHKAHDLIDRLTNPEAAHIHAYLHRKEGDLWNAGYWYERAGQVLFEGSLSEEWSYLWNLYGPGFEKE